MSLIIGENKCAHWLVRPENHAFLRCPLLISTGMLPPGPLGFGSPLNRLPKNFLWTEAQSDESLEVVSRPSLPTILSSEGAGKHTQQIFHRVPALDDHLTLARRGVRPIVERLVLQRCSKSSSVHPSRNNNLCLYGPLHIS